MTIRGRRFVEQWCGKKTVETKLIPTRLVSHSVDQTGHMPQDHANRSDTSVCISIFSHCNGLHESDKSLRQIKSYPLLTWCAPVNGFAFAPI
jgi:hypothetical protein